VSDNDNGIITVQEGVPYSETSTVAIDGVTGATTGYTSRLKVAYLGDLVLTLTEGSGLTTSVSTDLVTTLIQVTAVQTAALEHKRYDYQLDILLNGSVVLRTLQDALLVTQDIVTG